MIISWLKEWGAVVGLLGLIGIEIVPIKINPIRWLFRKIGSLLNQEIKKQVSTLAEKVDKIEESQDFTDIFNIKQSITNYHALLLSSGLDNNQYRRCFELESKYRFYQKKYPGRVNGHLDAMLEAIHNNYLDGNIMNMEVDNERIEISSIDNL